MSNACTPILVGGSIPVSEIFLLSKTAKFPFLTMDYIVHGHQKIESIGISSKNSCNYKLMSNACTPILVGGSIPVSEILLLSKTAKFPVKKLNQLESAQKKLCNYKLMSKACTPILVGGSIPVLEILLPSKTTKFPFLTMVIKKLNQLELAQKIYATIK